MSRPEPENPRPEGHGGSQGQGQHDDRGRPEPAQDPSGHGRRDQGRDRLGRVAGRGAEGRREQAFRKTGRGDERDGARDATTGQPAPEQVTSLGQPVAEGSFCAPQMIRRLVARQPLEVAEDDRQAEPIGEPLDLLVQDRAEIVGSPGLDAPQPARGLFDFAAAGGGGPGLERRPIRHPVQPGPHRIPAADRTRLAEQQHERGLERVVGRIQVLQDGPAGVQHQRPVPCHQRGERRLVPVGDEPLQQAGVG